MTELDDFHFISAFVRMNERYGLRQQTQAAHFIVPIGKNVIIPILSMCSVQCACVLCIFRRDVAKKQMGIFGSTRTTEEFKCNNDRHAEPKSSLHVGKVYQK